MKNKTLFLLLTGHKFLSTLSYKRISFFLFFLFLPAINYAQGTFGTNLKTLYSTYIKPGLFLLFLVLLIVYALIRGPKIVKGGDEAGDALMHFIMACAWPLFVLGLIEGLSSILGVSL
jgi:hypothetical protein